jgi:hypothetical protein
LDSSGSLFELLVIHMSFSACLDLLTPDFL